ncbi:hypothetical protein HAT2_00096 [Candidatus Similichlamydia laticola]|uniref:Uncharacterized protein n=1 Tax=Candidatus Similichlamydia laticola TaxID=2170265 RepID=A0A369KGG4_9BACT|nr:hypothetical protein HAT2_00096 [Candidatus Similichlamydia laticola]
MPASSFTIGSKAVSLSPFCRHGFVRCPVWKVNLGIESEEE